MLGHGGRAQVVGVFAHPDDESFAAGGLLAALAERGAEVTVISATRGERGQRRGGRISTGAELAAIRGRELAAACAAHASQLVGGDPRWFLRTGLIDRVLGHEW